MVSSGVRVHLGGSCKAPRVMRKKNMVMSPTGPGIKNDCVGEGQHISAPALAG
jgi:hypothetical protein